MPDFVYFALVKNQFLGLKVHVVSISIKTSSVDNSWQLIQNSSFDVEMPETKVYSTKIDAQKVY